MTQVEIIRKLASHNKTRLWIKHQRISLAMSQKDLAQAVGLATETIRAIEHGRRRLQPSHLPKILATLEVEENAYEQLWEAIQQFQPEVEHAPEQQASAGQEPLSAAGSEIADSEQPVAAEVEKPSEDAHIEQPSRRGMGLWHLRQRGALLTLPGYGSILLFGMMLGFLLASSWPEAVSFVRHKLGDTILLGITSLERCTNQPEEVPALWDAGASADSTCRFDENSFTITTGMDTIQDSNDSSRHTAPLLLYQAQGNFVARVKMEYDGGPYCCRNSGLGVRPPGDTETWIRITKDSRDYHINASGLVEGKTKIAHIAGEDLPTVRQRITYFEIVRQGTQVQMSYSLDGQHWLPYFTFQDIPLGEQVEVFLVVYADAHTPPVSATFSDFTLQQLP